MIYKYISQLANMQRRFIDRLSKNKEYSGTEEKVIHYLFVNSEKTVYQKHLESVFGLRAATATQVLDSLEKRGLIRRVTSKTDGRFKEIILTEKAVGLKQDIFSDMDTLENRIICGIDPEQLKTWREVTEKMIANLNEEN